MLALLSPDDRDGAERVIERSTNRLERAIKVAHLEINRVCIGTQSRGSNEAVATAKVAP